MNDIATQISMRDAASLIGWWRDMGIDSFIDEVPVAWLARSAAAAPQADLPKTRVQGERAQGGQAKARLADMPTTFSAFTQWLLTDETIPDAGPPARRIAPCGDAGSGMMILIDMPEAGDRDTLLSGDAGILFDKMLAAIGLDRSCVYLASVTPGRPVTGMIDEMALPRLCEIALHHVKLVAPKRLWLMGRAPSRAITGMNEIEAGGRLHKINHDGGTITVIASLHPRNLLQSNHRKAGVWADMQTLVQGMTV